MKKNFVFLNKLLPPIFNKKKFREIYNFIFHNDKIKHRYEFENNFHNQF